MSENSSTRGKARRKKSDQKDDWLARLKRKRSAASDGGANQESSSLRIEDFDIFGRDYSGEVIVAETAVGFDQPQALGIPVVMDDNTSSSRFVVEEDQDRVDVDAPEPPVDRKLVRMFRDRVLAGEDLDIACCFDL